MGDGRGCCFSFMKYTLAVFNFIVLGIGAAVLALGIYVLASKYGADKLQAIMGTEELYKAGVGLLIAAGCVTILIAFLGCCGACLENRVMLGIYFAIMLFLTCFFIVIVIIGFVFYQRVEGTIKTEAEKILASKYGKETAITDAWNRIQQELHCCGMTGDVYSNKSWAIYKLQSDWYQLQPNNQTRDYVPDSCCNQTVTDYKTVCQAKLTKDRPPSMDTPVTASTPVNAALYTRGCYDIMVSTITENGAIIGGIAAAALGVMIIGTIFSIALCCWIGRSKNLAV